MKEKNPENQFINIIQTIRSIEKNHATNRKSKLQLYGEKVWLAALLVMLLPFLILYLWHLFFPINVEVAQLILVAIFVPGIIIMCVYFILGFLDFIASICAKQISWDTLINRARIQYPVMNEIQATLKEKFESNTLSSFAEWANYRIKSETKFAILVGAFIAALPTFKALGSSLLWDIKEQYGYSLHTSIQNLNFFPISFEGLAFFVLFMVFMIQFISVRWARIGFYVNLASKSSD